MGKITKTLQPKHEETLSPWLKDFVHTACSTRLPLLPEHLASFPTRWPFPRGDLYHWISLLNRFDSILECFNVTYELSQGPQSRNFGCEILLGRGAKVEGLEQDEWSMEDLQRRGYEEEGDRQLVEAVLNFTRVLLEHCGNRSIYASSANLNDLLHTTSQSVIIATLQVGTELAKRYQASVKRVGSHSRHVSTALLANHYNMDLARVQHLAAPFIKTPLVSRSETAVATTPGSGAKAKDKAHGLGHGHGPGQKSSTTTFANDLGAIANSDANSWKGWADVKITYSPLSETHEPKTIVTTDRPTSTLPATPTPLRRSTSMGSPAHQTPRPARQLAGDESSPAPVARSPGLHHEVSTSRQHVFDLPHSVVASSSIHDLLSRCPPNLPAHAKYEFLNRVRVAKALIGNSESRQQALAVRLLAVTNLAYIHQESAFMEKVMRPDSDETRRFQLVYQLAELIHPSADGTTPVPLWLQAIAMALLEAVSNFSARCQDVLSALNANVNHGILLYVIRKAVSGMKEDDAHEEQGHVTEADEWRKELFSLTQHLSMSSRIGAEMVGAGLMDALVEILRIRSNVARRNQSTILSFIDGLIWSYQNAFQAFFNGTGLDAVSDLLVASVDDAKRATEAGRGTSPQLQSSVVDYEIPFYQQQTLKWLLKFMHHVMTNSYSIGGNTDRLLRNLVDKSDLLASLRGIMQRTTLFGSVLWTNSVTVLSDFINNDPTSYAAIAESGMIEGFLESVTGRPVPQQPVSRPSGDEASGGDANTTQIGEDRFAMKSDGQPHPPTQEMLASQKDRALARGILASPDAILAIPQVLNSISLNNAGLEMVSSSRAFDSFFEIFESPTHVDCLEGDHHLAGSVGESFDELARHHPALRTAISDAVIDMTARVRFLGKEKAITEGWGAKLVFGDATGLKLTADEGLPGRLHETSTSTSGKERSTSDEDVEMIDESRTVNKDGRVSIAKNDKSRSSSSFTPFVHALALFLGTYLTNHTMKANFIQRGGIEVLLDVAELPSLPHDFSDSNAARKLNAVIFQVIDHSPVLGLPSLLGRAQAAIDALEPFTALGHNRPYFMPFVESDKPLSAEDVGTWDVGTKDKILAGTTIVKSLLNLQTLLKAVCECFSSLPRSTAVQFYPANVFDYYLRIVRSVGPLLSASLTEEAAIHQVLPYHWWAKGSDAVALLDPSVAPETFGEAGNVSATGLTFGAPGSVSAEDNADKTSESQPSRPSEQEQATARYKNFQTLQGLLHSVVPSAFPFFQQLGKALFPRRERDSYSRQKHIEIAQQLSSSILEELRPSIVTGESTLRSYHYWIIMLHTLSEMLMDSFSRSGDRSGIQVIMPVYIAFAEQGGLEVLTSMARRFSDEIRQEHAQSTPNTAVKVCTFGLKKLLELFVTLVDGKYISESVSQFGLLPRSSQRRDDPQTVASQLVLEARIAIFPVVRAIWDSSLVEKTSTETLIRIIDILKTVSLGDYEPDHSRLPASDVLKKIPSSFAWQAHQTVISQLSTDFNDELAREGVFRANGNQNVAAEYCRLHREGKGGSRHPVPAEDAYTAPSAAQVGTSNNQEASSVVAPADSEPMAVDATPALDNLVSDAVLGELEDHSSQDSDDGDDDDGDEEDDEEDENNDVRTDSQPNASASSLPAGNHDSPEQTQTDGSHAVTKHELDQQREELRKDLISRSLDVVRAHPSAAIEVSELISATVFSRQDQEIREEVGTTLTSAITSLSVADGEEIDSATNGSIIAAYAHLFALLLRENAFLNCNLDNLRSTVDVYVDFLKVVPANSKEELPPWIPYILLIVELLLCHDERPVEATWKAPTTDNEPIRPPVIQKEEPILVPEQKENLLSCIMDLLPRLGKNDTLAISVLRVLVILTRQRPLANKVGEKKNLQRLFVMAKQLAGAGANQLKDTKTAGSIMIILRHIVEDEETVKQVMRAEIRQLFENPQRTQRNLDVVTYLRNLAPVALRSPDIFVEVTNEMTKLSRWAPLSEGNNRSHQLALKQVDAGAAKENEGKDESVEPAVQATEDLSLQDVKRSTETGDKEMSDARKSTVPRPVVENPDGVVHFLLCELLNYRDVDDKDAAPIKDDKDVVSEELLKSPTKNVPAESQTPSAVTASTPPVPPQAPESKENKDKKTSKPTFKAEDHPIFIYRCFLLNCLSELLQSYNSSKVEFINFKRSAPLQTNTPVKPRSSALNYLIHDLLCHGNTNENADSLLAKKKAATSSQAQQVLVALVTRTGEKALDKHKDRYEFDDDPDLLFVRKFSLDTILRSYERASSPEEPLDSRYSKMQCLADLMNQIIGEKERDPPGPARVMDSPQTRSQAQLRRMMYEKGYLDKLTSSIADLDLNQVGVKRAVKHVLRVLRVLTDTAKELSRSSVLPSMALPDSVDDEIASSSSMSDLDDDREETPDLYRNSALGMLEPRGSDDESDDEGDDDEEMYDGEYGDELDYGDEEISEDGENDISDDDEEDFGEMGDIEGLHGDPGVVEVVMDDDDEDMEDDDDHDDDDELSEEDELDSDEMDDRDIVEEIVVDNGDHLEDDENSGWEDESDEDAADEEEDMDYEAEAQDLEEAHIHGMDRGDIIDNLARAVMDPDDDFDPEDMDDLGDHYLEDGRGDADDDEDDDVDDDEYLYDEDYPHDEAPPVNVPGQLGWDTLVLEPFHHGHTGHRHRHGQRSPFPPGFIAGGPRDPLGGMFPNSQLSALSDMLLELEQPPENTNAVPDFRSYFSRRHRATPPQSNPDDGTNPLLRRTTQDADPAPRPGAGPGLVGLRLPPEIFGPGAGGGRGNFFESPMALLNDIVASLPALRHGHGPQSLHLSISPGGRGDARDYHLGGMRPGDPRGDGRRDGVYHEPQQAVTFNPYSTFERYEEEVRMIFGGSQYVEKAQKLANLILSKLVPPAMEHEKKIKAEEEERRRVREEERKKREEEERRVREAKEAEEKAEREKQEAEERAERERAAAEAVAPAATEATPADVTGSTDTSAMEGVEAHGAADQLAADVPRVVTTLRGEEVDITELGIDPDYLAALPEEFREEVIAQTVSSRRSQAREDAASGEQTEVFQEFLDALPEEMRSEIVQQERQEIRRRERDEMRRQTTGAAQEGSGQEMDAASILLTFPPELRSQVLMEQGEDLMEHLPPDMAAQVRVNHRPTGGRSPPTAAGRRSAPQHAETEESSDNKTRRKTVVQMLDKAGVATLLRLMFVSHQNGSIRNNLFSVLADVCENRSNRLEVVSTILLILQEGSTDMEAVDRSFSQLSLKAKRPKDKDADPRTPTQNLKRTLTSLTVPTTSLPNSEISPLVVVNQCLDLLQDLSTKNPHIPMLFLNEHESVGSSLKRSASRKGKSKDKDTKAHKYAINSLLSLLDRDLVMQSSDVMAYLADLLNKLTVPLATMERRRREAAEKAAADAKKAADEASAAAGDATTTTTTTTTTGADVDDQHSPGGVPDVKAAEGEKKSEGDGSQGSQTESPGNKKDRQMQVPVIPSHNLMLVVKVFVARECSSKTFQNTISTIKNLSAIPGAKATFGQELVHQAQTLSKNIVSDLDELLPHILKATSGTDIQGVALSKFSPGASEQNKLLRVLTALDHLFDNKKKPEYESSNEKQDLVSSLYQNPTFSKMWEKLGECLGAIRQRENMVNIATILLPLIESLMVVCKNTAMTETQATSQPDKEMVLSSPPPEDRMAGLFFNFTEDHRRILNELVRNNPKLMSGTFALLVKNPKVLEFDNKRNYFNRSVHSRANAQRASFPTLQLAVRREHVFHDSFRSLYFKSGEEMKYGKLSIRFHGEEGVDAGGVTREWFQVLARQMFDANYVLFTPVSSDRTTFHPNKLSGINDMHLMYFKFVGRIIGKALYEGRVIDCYFSRAVYKRMLGKSVSVKDMESFDPDYYKSLVWMLENDITDIITETFSVEDDEFGVTTIVDLCPDGRNIPVTEENKHDYVRLVVEHKLLSSVKEQMEHFLKGFHEIIPAELISIFNEQELELLISGLPDIDIDDWKSNTEYHNYNPSSQQIQWFWRAVKSLDKEELAKLLQFVTGTSKVPLNGFKELEGMNGVNRFNIHRDYGNKDRLPSSHTCFNQLDLPEYESYEALRAQLMKAITAGSEYFGFA